MPPFRHRVDTRANWSAENAARLRYLWGVGKSATQIVKVLNNGATRNAVIGKVHRMKLKRFDKVCAHEASFPGQPLSSVGTPSPSTGGKTDSAPIKRKPAKAPPKPKPEVPAMQVAETPSLPPVGFVCEPVALAGIEPEQCKYPIGDPSSAEFRFCGAPMSGRRPYCAEHAERCYLGIPKPKTTSPRNHVNMGYLR